MDGRVTADKNVAEIEIIQLLQVILRKAWLILLVAAVCAALTFLVTFFFVDPQYEASALFYVNNTSRTAEDTSDSISAGDLSASKSLVDTYIVILNTKPILMDVIEQAQINRSCSELEEMISATAVNETQVLKVSVTGTNPVEIQRIADVIAKVLPQRLNTIVEGGSTKVLDVSSVPTTPISPNYAQNTIAGFLIGFVLMTVAILLREILKGTGGERTTVLG